MDAEVKQDLESKIRDICDTLFKNNKLVTTKSVLSILFDLSSNLVTQEIEEYTAKIINLWRLSKVEQTTKIISKGLNKVIKNKVPSNLQQKLVKYKKV